MAKSTYVKVAIAAFIGKLLTVIFVAVSVMIGVGPDRWAAFLLDGFPKWITPVELRTGLPVLATLVSVQLVWPLVDKIIDRIPVSVNRTRRMMAGIALLAFGSIAAAAGIKIIYGVSSEHRIVAQADVPFATQPSISSEVIPPEKFHKLEEEHVNTVNSLAAVTRQFEELKTSQSANARANVLLVRERQLAQFEELLDRSIPDLKNQAVGVLQTEIDKYTKPVMLGRDRPIIAYMMSVQDLKEKLKAFIDPVPEIKKPDPSSMAVIAPREEEIKEEANRVRYRFKWHEIEETNAWLDSLPPILKEQKARSVR